MIRKAIQSFWAEDRAAISPLYAVGILALVAVSGIGFDYGRLMALDSELQNAADEAALAAATQLDGGTDAITRARNAATNTFASTASPYFNETRFANDKRLLASGTTSTRPITNLTFVFYSGYTGDAPVGAALSDSTTDQSNAKVVEVTVNSRKVFYALTPVVGAISSGNVIGKAMAALESATCNVPPMMFCVPYLSGTSNPDLDFPQPADIGKGLKLHFKSTGNDSPGNPNQHTTDTTAWAPGNFGFLDIDYFPSNQQNRTTGMNAYTLGCTGAAPTSDPGFRTPQGSALNSRFDIYNPPVNKCVAGTGDFCPAKNTTKQLVLPMPAGTANCDSPPNNIKSTDWVDASTLTGLTEVATGNTAVPGFPEDTNLAGSSTAVIGNKDWGNTAWLSTNYGVSPSAIPETYADGNVSRYEVYQWQLDPASTSRLNPVLLTNTAGAAGNRYCSFRKPVDQPPGLAASPTQKDRRLMTVAAVDCTSLNGKAAVKVLRWVDLFLVKPVDTTGSDRSFFTEIAGPAKKADGSAGFQYFGRKKALLIR